MKTAIIIVNFNGWRDSIGCLESVFRMSGNWRVILCDNGSRGGDLDRIEAWARGALDFTPDYPPGLPELVAPAVPKPVPCLRLTREEAEAPTPADPHPDLVLVDCGANLGFAGANNVGLRYALARNEFDSFWLLNNDTRVHRDALLAMLRRLEQLPDAGICGSTLLYFNRPSKVQARGGAWYCPWIGLPWHLGRERSVDRPFSALSCERRMSYVVGASMLVTRRFVREVGLMNEGYFLYFEELDWALRGKRFRLAYAPESRVYHRVGASVGSSSHPARKSDVSD
ncbi:MAG: glycosyltransferase, partial [Deltaproteobacteria bacterium]